MGARRPPVVEILFDVEDGGALRRVRYEHLFGGRAAKRYKPGRTVPLWVDRTTRTPSAPGR